MRHRHHEQSVEQLPLSTMDICMPEQGCAEIGEGEYGERFSPRVEEYINDMVMMAENWSMAMLDMPKVIAQRRQDEEAALDHGFEDADRSVRRVGNRYKDAQVLATIAWAHNMGRSLARPELPSDAPRLAAISDSDQLTDRMNAIAESLHQEYEEDDMLVKRFHLLFIAEELTHAQMAVIELADPRAFREIFDPSALSDLPPALQQLASIDIGRDKESIILRNARRTLEDNRTSGQQLADYLANNHLPDGIRQIVTGIQLGAKAMGAPICPLNDTGLCTKVLERISPEDLPESLQRDMALRASKSTQDRIAKLVQFSRTNTVPRMFDSAVVFDYSDPSESGTVSSKKRRQSGNNHSTKVDRRDIVVESFAELAEPTFHTVSVVVAGEGNEPITFAVNDDMDIDSASVTALLETKPFKEYMATYRNVNLRDLLTVAAQQILFRPDYKGTNGMIVPLVDRKKTVNHAGVPERLNRFSGQRTDLQGSGKIGRQTRIIFSQGTKDGVRHVTIHKVAHKSEVEKRINL